MCEWCRRQLCAGLRGTAILVHDSPIVPGEESNMRGVRISTRKILAHAIAASLAVPSVALADTIAVDGVTCTLADAIISANSDTATGGCTAGNGRDEIQIGAALALLGSLPTVTSDIDFVGVGGSAQIGGDFTHRLFMIGDESHAPNVTFANLYIYAGFVLGGGANNGGGAGAGLGGAMFIYDGSVSIDLSNFSENGATGGTTAGVVAAHTGGGGGGGLFGGGGGGALSNQITGGDASGGGVFGGGGGGGGNTLFNEGGGGNGGGGSGTFPGPGGTLFPLALPGAGGFGGGGGGGAAPGGPVSASQPGADGGFAGGGGGGAGSGTTGNLVDTPGTGGNGGFGGGGGAGGSATAAQGAAGGFGGFGGGGGSPGTGTLYGAQGQGGFGGGNSFEGGGGGGAGFGGAIFVRSGHLDVTNTGFESSVATRGLGPGGNGQAKGGAIFAVDSLVNTNGNNQGMPFVLPRVTGCSVTFALNNVAADAGTSNRDNADVFGADRTGLVLECGDRIFNDGFDAP
jgi:hypothetical protein